VLRHGGHQLGLGELTARHLQVDLVHVEPRNAGNIGA
jgi:hypothetical protein